MLKSLVSFVKDDGGDAVSWIVVIIIGIIIAVAAYVKLKGAPGNIGEGIENAGDNAKEGLDSVRY